ncbi:MAG: hypothetical protein K9L68_15315 [Spirochaetales bacterium]|nr:hypothetical protein [Spirochaetales bacterium]
MRSKIFTSAAVCLFWGILLNPLYAEQKQFTLGFEDNWDSVSEFEGTRLEKGLHGFLDISLDHRRYNPEDVPTDLLLHFEEPSILDETGRYSVSSRKPMVLAGTGRIGQSAVGFSRESGGLLLEAVETPGIDGDGPLFQPGALWGDFTLEFWIRPGYLENGEKLLQWQGQRLLSGQLQLQRLECEVRNRMLIWNFENFFLHPQSQEITFSLKGKRRLVPDRWSHHLLRFRAETGLLEYLINGIPEAVLYTTTDGTSQGSVMRPYIGKRSRGSFEIAPVYSGLMDEFRLSRYFVEEPQLRRLSSEGGEVKIGPLSLGEEGSKIDSIEIQADTPPGTSTYYYYRLAGSRPAFDIDGPEWVPFTPGEELNPPTKGSFFEVKYILFPDGEGLRSPRISNMRVNYRPNLPPPPPVGLTAVPKNGKIHLSWRALQQQDLGGYLVYYGDSSGVYRGNESSAGASPIDAGTATDITLPSLENGKLYFITIAAYDTAGPSHRGPFSPEVSARPSAYYGE